MDRIVIFIRSFAILDTANLLMGSKEDLLYLSSSIMQIMLQLIFQELTSEFNL